MADNEPTISMAGINAPPLYRLVEDGDKTVIMTADTNTPMWVINGKIGGSVEAMTTAERTAITPGLGELIWDIELEMLFAGDGETAGGIQVSPGTGGGDYTQGYGIEITSGSTISRAPFGTIETVDVSGASPSVTMVPGHAYSINATAKAVTLNVTPFNADQFGIDEGHLEIFVAGTGYVVTGTNVELTNALEPDAINYCTVRFVGGVAKIALEDNIGGYIVISATGTTAGTLPYALGSASQEYVAFDASLNGQTFDMAGAVTNGEKHVVGNGYSDTVLTGGVSCTSKTTFSNLSMENVSVLGGTMTLGDVFLPHGATVTAAGGLFGTEKLVGNGGIVNLNGNAVSLVRATKNAYVSGIIISGFSRSPGAASGTIYLLSSRSARIDSCMFTSNYGYGGVASVQGGTLELNGCVVSGNTYPLTVFMSDKATVDMSNCTFANNQDIALTCPTGATEFTKLNLAGSNVFEGRIYGISNSANNIDSTGIVTIASGAIVDLTGNTNATPIKPGGGIIVSGGCTIINSAGASVSIEGGTYTKINNDGTTE